MTPVVVAADESGAVRAAAALAAGQVVLVPTDTVYGLAVDPTVPGATEQLFAAKRRPRTLPIAVLVADEEQAWNVADAAVPPVARQLTARWWPGPLTVIVGRGSGWPANLGDAGNTVGLRCPDHDWMRGLCRLAGPLATTSANVHGRPTPPDAGAAAAEGGRWVTVVVDGGRCEGRPSTVVDCTSVPPRLVREGALSATALGL